MDQEPNNNQNPPIENISVEDPIIPIPKENQPQEMPDPSITKAPAAAPPTELRQVAKKSSKAPTYILVVLALIALTLTAVAFIVSIQ